MDLSIAENTSNDYHMLPVTEKQVGFARSIAERSGLELPDRVLQDRRRLSDWIDAHKARPRQTSRFDAYASSKQVRFAEAIARRKRSVVPPECFKDKDLMSRWIDANR